MEIHPVQQGTLITVVPILMKPLLYVNSRVPREAVKIALQDYHVSRSLLAQTRILSTVAVTMLKLAKIAALLAPQVSLQIAQMI
jgi:hypothetical protein